MTIDFGVIDHLDQQDVPIDQTYDSRLALIELYDRAGFSTFHLTEHHFTPLGLAPSPLIFLTWPPRGSRATSAFVFRAVASALQSAAPCRRNLHARPPQQRPARHRCRAGDFAVRACLLQRQPSRGCIDLSGSLRCADDAPTRDTSIFVELFPGAFQCADAASAVSEAAPAVVVRIEFAGGVRLGRGAESQCRVPRADSAGG